MGGDDRVRSAGWCLRCCFFFSGELEVDVSWGELDRACAAFVIAGSEEEETA